MMRRFSFTVILSLLAMLFAARPAAAQSDVFQIGTDTLSIRVVTKWVGGSHGGYLPVRVRIVNTGPSRTLKFRIEPSHSRGKFPVVTKTVDVERNATAQLTLSVPLVGNGMDARLKVLGDDGKEIDGLQQRFHLPAPNETSPFAPAVLGISDATINGAALEQAVLAISNKPGRSATSSRSSISHSLVSHGNVDGALLPESWIDYSSVDIIVVDFQELQRLGTKQRSAILMWVQCGGTLIVGKVGERPQDSKGLARVLQLQEPQPQQIDWKLADLSLRGEAAEMKIPPPQQVHPRSTPGQPPTVRVAPPTTRDYGQMPVTWPNSRAAFVHREEMLGTIVAFEQDPFTGSARDWVWLLTSLGGDRYQWTTRHGMSARQDTKEFFKFLIPGVKGVPIYAFLFMMTVFTLIIGPLNYVLLWKRKQLFLLVLTIPAIAFVTSLSLFGYSAISHGLSVKSRVRSVTILDQRSQVAVTTTRVALFAGLAPSDGLSFSESTAVFPIWPESGEFEVGTVEWAGTQNFKSGWLKSRTRTQFLTQTRTTERGRLEIGPLSDDGGTVVNGFDHDIRQLVVADGKGRLYLARNIKAGQSSDLSPVDSKQLREFTEVILKNRLELPDAMTELTNQGRRNQNRGFRRSRSQNIGYRNEPKFAASRMETRISQIGKLSTNEYQLPPNTYAALLDENPRVDIGLSGTDEVAAMHLLIGYYQGQ